MEKTESGKGIDIWGVLAATRFALASIVVFNHLPLYTPLQGLQWLPKFGAFEAILGFLLVSGFSIACSYQQQPEGFLLRRAKRIFPVYLAAMVATAVAGFLVRDEALPALHVLILNGLLLNQLLTTGSYVGPAWSLSLEFWLYCAAPMLMKASGNRLVQLAGASFVLYCTYTVLRSVFDLPYYSGVGFGANLLFLSFPWIAGLYLARCGSDAIRIRQAISGIGLLLGLHWALGVTMQFAFRLKHASLDLFLAQDLPGFAAQAVTLALVATVLWLSAWQVGRPARRSPALRFAGDVSYPLYLLHIPILDLLYSQVSVGPLSAYAISVLGAAVVYVCVDGYSRRRHVQRAVS